jgi:diguanylate cyclase (GGDEF)-like protein
MLMIIPRRISKGAIGYGLILAVGVGLGVFVNFNAERDFETAREHYIETSTAEAGDVAEKVQGALRSIYENLRTLSLLLSVQQIDRHGTNLGGDARETIQQIYNNMASNVAVSEVYIVPEDINPDKIDPITGKEEEPILMFDQRIVDGESLAKLDGTIAGNKVENKDTGGKQEESEYFEYHQFQKQLDWLRKNYANRKSITGSKIPMISGQEIITFDNIIYKKILSDTDRFGMVFSVPFYGPDGKLKGSISAVILSEALRNLLPRKDFALVNANYHYVSRANQSGQENASAEWVAKAERDPTLIYSQVIPISVNDPSGTWVVWAGKPNSDFYIGAEALNALNMERFGYAVIAALTCGLLACWMFIQNHFKILSSREAQIGFMATHDALTNLPNRAALNETMQSELPRLREGEMLALLCLDLDRFKAVNDTLGHPIGDALLRAVTGRVENAVRNTDCVARLGGDEFVIVQLDLAKPEEAEALALRIIGSVSEPFELEGHQVVVGASIGIALAPVDGDTAEDLLRNADMALYRAKADGRGCCRFFAPEMDTRMQERRLLDLDLRHAIVADEFILHYQPLYDSQMERINCFEALLRWQHPKRGMVSPMDFIPLAEEIGVIVPIGEWALRRACAEAVTWPNHIRVAVNLSAAQFKQPSLPFMVASALADSGLLPSRLELEITETVLLHDNESNMAMLHALRALGVRIAMDDFGTGYSSLSYLRSFPFDKIKIDRSFVKDLTGTNDAATIIRAVASLGNNLGMETTAEGIETMEQFIAVRDHGCTQVQGFYFSRPLSSEKVTELLAGKIAAIV